MSVHKTKDGRHFVVYWPAGRQASAKRKYFGRGRDNELAAQEWDLNYKKAKRVHDHPAVENLVKQDEDEPTFLDVAQAYLKRAPMTDKSRQAIYYALDRWVTHLFGRKPVSGLSMKDLSDLDAALIDRKHKKTGKPQPASLSTRNRYRSYCRAILSWWLREGMIAKQTGNPFADFRPQRKKEGQAPDLVTDEEIKKIWNEAAPHLQWAIRCMLNLGVRPGPTELFAIRMQDVDIKANGIWIKSTKTYGRPELHPVLPDFLQELQDLLKKEPGRQYLIEYQGKPVRSLKTSWWAALRRAGIYQKGVPVSEQPRQLRLYDLRHKFVSILLAAGADLKAVSNLIGHASPDTTIKVYYHLLDRQKRQAIDLLDLPKLESA